MDAFNWLHLTDLHWGLTGQKHLWPDIRQKFFESLEEVYEKTKPWHAVLFTGDFVQKGTKAEFDDLEHEVLGPLWEHFQKLGCSPALLAVPGNHDLQRPVGDAFQALEGAVDLLMQPGGFRSIAEKFWTNETSQFRQVVNQVFSDYRNWQASRPHCPPTQTINSGRIPGDFSTTFVTKGKGRHKIGIVGLNIAFLQLADAIKAGDLACDVRQFHGVCQPDGVAWTQQHDICLLMTHQPPDWLDGLSQKKEYLAINPPGRFAVHLFGHMHDELIRTCSTGGAPMQRVWQGRSLFGMEDYAHPIKEDRRHGYAVGTLSFEGDHAVLRHWPRQAIPSDSMGWRFRRDEDKCLLEDDGGTKPEVISLPSDRGSAAIAPLPETIEQLTTRALGNYHSAAQRDWDDRWSGVIGEDKV